MEINGVYLFLWGVKLRSYVFGNCGKAKKVMWHISKLVRAENIASKITSGNLFLYVHTEEHILPYFITVLYVLKHHRVTNNLKKYRWFQYMCEFVGMYVAEVGAQPAQSKLIHLPRYINLIYGDIWEFSLRSLDSIDIYLPCMSCTYKLVVISFQNSLNQEKYLKINKWNWFRDSVWQNNKVFCRG